MKMGNDDEKASPPMFPRLHVNDTEKGGPKAPPRNKMALYEQLSIPSQRFNPGVFPLRPNNSSKVVPIPSSSQPSIPIHQAERYDTRRNNEANLNSALAQLEHSKEVGDDDDLRVPVFDQSRMDPRNTQNGISRENVASSGLMYSGSSKIVRSYGLNKSRASISSSRISLVQEVTGRSQDGLVSDAQSAKSATNFSRGYMIDGFVTEANASLNQDFQDSKACDIDDCVGQESRAIELPDDSENEVGFQPGSDYYSGEKHSNLNDIDNDSGHSVNGIYSPSQEGNQERSDAVSETSMLDSISCFDISPDDVVEMIGLEHFWKARRAIINQQKVFAVQVFELHRLIKVQRLMAGSQNILLEGGGVGALKGNSSVKVSPAMKLPLEDITKAQACFKRKNDSRKTDHKVFAENAVRKARPFSLRNVSQTSDYGPYSGNPQTTPPVTGIKMGDWCFNQSPGHQWLFPVMSPEGLIYKPYLRRPGPMYSSTMNPAYGFPSCHYKGVGYPYLPPYVMGITNPALSGSAVEQMNWFTGPHSNVQTNQLSGVTDADDMNHQNSYSIQTSKNGALSKESELQVQATSIVEGVEPLDSDQPTRVIRIVPHNRRSATKSATRIFHSIQEERKLHDSI